MRALRDERNGRSFAERDHRAASAAWLLLVAGVLAVFLSRLFVHAGAPEAINFVHYPILLAAYAAAPRSRTPRAVRTLERLLSISIIAVGVAWFGSQYAVGLQSLLLWPVLAEPFIVVATLWRLGATGFDLRRAQRLSVVLIVAQAPLVVAQIVASGTGDPVQGTFVGSGAGAHVLGLGALALALATLPALMRVPAEVGEVRWQPRLARLALIAGFAIGFLTLIRQGIILFFLLAAWMVLMARRQPAGTSGRTRSNAAIAVGTAVAITAVVVFFVGGFQHFLTNQELLFGDLPRAKVNVVTDIRDEMHQAPHRYVTGLGPGTSATRVAMLTTEVGSSSFLASFGLEPTPLAAQLAAEFTALPQWLQSSATSPFASWIGVFGDLGLLGLVTFGAMWVVFWRTAGWGATGLGAKAVILFAVILGGLFGWLEEPGTVVMMALLVGSSIPERMLGRSPAQPSVGREQGGSQTVGLAE